MASRIGMLVTAALAVFASMAVLPADAAPGATSTSAKTAVSPLFSAYRDLCLATGGDPAKALTTAKAEGWREPTPDDLLPLGVLSMSQGQQRERTEGGVRLRFAVARAEDPAGLGLRGASWQVCIVSREPADPAAGAALQTWAAVSPMAESDPVSGSALFVIADPESSSRRTAQGLAEGELQTLIQQRRIIAAGAKTIGPLTILLYAAPAS